MATSLAVPVAYITVLVTALAIFSRVYRKRKAAEVKSWEPWFPTHPARDVYISLLSASPPDSDSTSAGASKAVSKPSTATPGPVDKVPVSILKSALLVRATADVKRIWRLRDDKVAITQLHQRGLIGDDTMARFAAAEKELEAEIVDVVAEANTFRPGWGSLIFQTATEMAHAERTREIVGNIPKIKAYEERKLIRRRKYLPEKPSQPTIAPTMESAPTASIPTTPAKSKGNSPLSSRSSSPLPASSTGATSGSSSLEVPSLNSLTPAAAVTANGSMKTGAGSAASTPTKTGSGKKKKGKK